MYGDKFDGDLEQEKVDPYDLDRFLKAQDEPEGWTEDYPTALSELKNGKKETHWMWYIFPQIKGLGSSDMDKIYSIESLAEAKAYLQHLVLRSRLIQCAQALLNVEGKTAEEIMGSPDYLKLKSSMTLFEVADGSIEEFGKILDKYYNRERDQNTIKKLE